MSEPWYRKVGFFSNPFSIKPAAFHDELIAYDLDFIYRKIDNGEMLFIDGTFGTGKTTILKNIINRYKGKRRVIYYNFNRADKEFVIEKLLSGATTFVNKMLGMMPKDVILLLDEVTVIRNQDAKSLLTYYDRGNIKSVVFVNHDYYSVKLPAEIEKLLEGNVIRTAQLAGDEAVALVRKRIGEISILSDSMIRKIFANSEKNPRRLLENCEDICKYAVENGDVEVDEQHINEVLGLKATAKTAKKARKPAVPKAKKAEPVKRPEMKVDPVKEEKPAAKAEAKPKAVKRPEKKPEVVQIENSEEEPKERQKKFKKNKLLEETKGETIIPHHQVMGEEEPSVSEKGKKDDVTEYNIVFYNQ